MRTAALERAVGRAAAAPRPTAEHCVLCAVALSDAHPHLLDVETAEPCCVCRACSLLFERTEGRYQKIPDRRLRLDSVRPASLGVPVGLAFFVLGRAGDVSAHYPSPGGATRWYIERDRWDAVRAECPALDSLQPGAEALLVDTMGDRTEAWVVPVTDCYRLVGIVRQNWSGLSGGQQVWSSIRAFFDQLRSSDGIHPSR